jgi:hypothetical protein
MKSFIALICQLLLIDFLLTSKTNLKFKFKYAVGQPMGAYSSWAMLALSHHVLVQISARRAGMSNFRDYAILGDDIVIRNKRVSDEYMLIMNDLGVSINLSKSVIASGFAEFAKRWVGPSQVVT